MVTKDEVSLPETNVSVTVIVPTYNEDPELLNSCLQSIIDADVSGIKEIFLIDDGSTTYNNKNKILASKDFSLPVNTTMYTHRFETNQGKRNAQAYAIERATGDVIITVDSDTILKKDAITEILKLFQEEGVAAVTANVRVLNTNKLLPKIIDARYHNAFEIERAMQSRFGVVVCCSGVLSAYRTDVIKPLLFKYTNQYFNGRLCNYGDDRHLTSLVLKLGYKSKYATKAVAYTLAPETIKHFVKQQLRWKKSFIRESYLLFKYMFKRSWYLSINTIYDIMMPILSFFVRASIIIMIVVRPLTAINFIIAILFMGFIRNLILYAEEGKTGLYGTLYGFIHELFVFPLYPIALLTMNDNKWGTR